MHGRVRVFAETSLECLPSSNTPLAHTEAHVDVMRRLRGEVDIDGTETNWLPICSAKGYQNRLPVSTGQQKWSPCSVAWVWAALATSQARSRHPHQPAISSRRRWRTSRVQHRTSCPPFLAGTTGRSRRRARRRARARGRSKPARRRPPPPRGLLMIFPRGALPRPRRRRPRLRRARS